MNSTPAKTSEENWEVLHVPFYATRASDSSSSWSEQGFHHGRMERCSNFEPNEQPRGDKQREDNYRDFSPMSVRAPERRSASELSPNSHTDGETEHLQSHSSKSPCLIAGEVVGRLLWIKKNPNGKRWFTGEELRDLWSNGLKPTDANAIEFVCGLKTLCAYGVNEVVVKFSDDKHTKTSHGSSVTQRISSGSTQMKRWNETTEESRVDVCKPLDNAQESEAVPQVRSLQPVSAPPLPEVQPHSHTRRQRLQNEPFSDEEMELLLKNDIKPWHDDWEKRGREFLKRFKCHEWCETCNVSAPKSYAKNKRVHTCF